MYNKVTQADIEKLRAIVGPEEVLTGEAINPDLAHDELGGISRMPEAVVRVRSTEQVSAVMKLAFERTIPVTVRGSGTGLVGAAVPIHGGILLETTKMFHNIHMEDHTYKQRLALSDGKLYQILLP